MNTILSETEQKVYNTLIELAERVGKPDDMSKKGDLPENVVEMCSSWNMIPRMSQITGPRKLASILISLRDKGLVKQYEDKHRYPSYVPSTYSQYISQPQKV